MDPITIDEARELLASVGIVLPDFILQRLVNKANSIIPCLVGNGYSADDAALIMLYLVGLMGTVLGDRYVTSQTAPSGASQSFRFGSVGERYDAIYGWLSLLDTHGCAAALIPPNPHEATAALFVSTGGDYCE